MPKNRRPKTMSFDAIGRDLTPSEVVAAKAFADKYSPGGNLPSRAEVEVEQRRVMAEVHAESIKGQPLPLLPLSAFQDAFPKSNWETPKPAAVVPLREGERFVVLLETSDVLSGYGPWRTEELAQQGIACCEQDAHSFARGLLDAVHDRLSIYELQHVVEVFAAELQQREAERQAAGAPVAKNS